MGWITELLNKLQNTILNQKIIFENHHISPFRSQLNKSIWQWIAVLLFKYDCPSVPLSMSDYLFDHFESGVTNSMFLYHKSPEKERAWTIERMNGEYNCVCCAAVQIYCTLSWGVECLFYFFWLALLNFGIFIIVTSSIQPSIHSGEFYKYFGNNSGISYWQIGILRNY